MLAAGAVIEVIRTQGFDLSAVLASDSLHEVVAVDRGVTKRVPVHGNSVQGEAFSVMRPLDAWVAVCGVEEFHLGRSEPSALKRVVLEPRRFP